MPNDVFRSADDGQSFQQRNLNITLGWFENVRVAPSDTDRVYVSGWVPPQPDGRGGFTEAETLLYRSDDAGAMWSKLTPAGIDPGEKLYVDVVSPTNPDLLFARVPLFPDSMQDTIFRSADGGATWTNELSLSIETTYPTDPPGQARIAARSDGTTYLAGSALGGFHISTDSGQTWNATPRPPMTWCVRERRDGVVYACSENWDPDMAFDETVRAGLVNGTNATDWSHVVRFIEIAGPLECPDETIQAQVCEERWCDMANMFGITPPAYCNDAQLPDAGPGDGDAGTDPPPDDDCENCGCSVGFASIVFVLPPFSRRRRRRRSLIP
jgi:hypothetical protein